MKWNKFKNNVGSLVEIQPPACELDSYNRPIRDLDGDWLIQSVDGDQVALRHAQTGHSVTLGKDHLYNYVTNPGKSTGTQQHGFLRLHVQLFVQGENVTVKPTVKPAERLPLSNQPHHQIQWTPYKRVPISEVVPPTARFIQIQYRLWSDAPAVPLQIRIASEKGAGVMVEHSGPAGVINLMLTNQSSIYVSLSHPLVCWELQGLGWKDQE
ncbi:MAG TPA: hypothetical protein VF445_11550 [Bordetella sp.]|uniref:hypothetical protein n=1 Tax=Bordetella sp. TaxID=28081 RepID=UPI002ED52EA2